MHLKEIVGIKCETLIEKSEELCLKNKKVISILGQEFIVDNSEVFFVRTCKTPESQACVKPIAISKRMGYEEYGAIISNEGFYEKVWVKPNQMVYAVKQE
jgi:hypothetical protein